MQSKYKRGFTLIELMIVIAIIMIIAAIAIPQLMKSKMSANKAAVVAAIKDYAEKQKRFSEEGQYRYSGNTAAPGGYVANFRNLYYGNRVNAGGQVDQAALLKFIPKEMADAFIVDPGNTNITGSPAAIATPFHGYLFREPKELDPRQPDDFAETFGLLAYPVDSATSGDRAYWIGREGRLFYQDLPPGRTAQADSDIDTPSGDSTTRWSGM